MALAGLMCAYWVLTALGAPEGMSLTAIALLVPIACFTISFAEKRCLTWKSFNQQLVFVFGTAVVSVLILVFRGVALPGILEPLFATGSDRLFSIAAYAFIVATGEELVFRKYLLNYLNCHMRVPWAILVSAVIFSGAHLSISPILLLLGVFFGAVALRFKSVVAVIGFHAIYDLLGLLATFVKLPEFDQATVIVSSRLHGSYVWTLSWIAILFLLRGFVVKLFRTESNEQSNGPGSN